MVFNMISYVAVFRVFKMTSYVAIFSGCSRYLRKSPIFWGCSIWRHTSLFSEVFKVTSCVANFSGCSRRHDKLLFSAECSVWLHTLLFSQGVQVDFMRCLVPRVFKMTSRLVLSTWPNVLRCSKLCTGTTAPPLPACTRLVAFTGLYLVGLLVCFVGRTFSGYSRISEFR